MTDKRIKRLNHELGLSLGFAGTNPRFAWVWAPDLHYVRRSGERYVRHCWADRLGKVWLLAKWDRTNLTPQEWKAAHRGEFPYPAQGMYYALPETLLKPGLSPDENDTAHVIKILQAQMEKDYQTQLREIQADADKTQSQTKENFYDVVDDDWPAFNNFQPNRSGHVSWGGIRDVNLPSA